MDGGRSHSLEEPASKFFEIETRSKTSGYYVDQLTTVCEEFSGYAHEKRVDVGMAITQVGGMFGTSGRRFST